MDLITIEQARAALRRDPDSGEYVDALAAYGLNAQHIELYDPPVDGETPKDGAGDPRKSLIAASQFKAALLKGFTEKPEKARRHHAADVVDDDDESEPKRKSRFGL